MYVRVRGVGGRVGGRNLVYMSPAQNRALTGERVRLGPLWIF